MTVVRHSGQTSMFPGAISDGNLIFTSGVVAPRTLIAGSSALLSFEEEAREAVGALLEAVLVAGGTAETVRTLTVYLRSRGDFPIWNAVFAETWPPDKAPARAVVIADFALPTINIELQCIAVPSS